MNLTVNVKKEVQVKTLIADMGVRYWEDGQVNGAQDDDDDPKMPLKSGDAWKLEIDLATGKIANWPEGTTAKTHYKVCDAGVYKLLDESGEIICETDGYVPSMLCPQDSGYGDYVIMSIDGEGFIEGFKADLSYFEEEDY